MAKRRPLAFDSEGLAKDLKASTGQGVDALFSSHPSATQADEVQQELPPTKRAPDHQTPAKAKKKGLGVKKVKASKMASKQTSLPASNIAILQLDEVDIEQLREAAYKAQTYRFAEREVEWIKDTAYNLSKELRRGKVSQVDILRVAIKLFENALASGKADLVHIFERMK